MDRGYGLVYSKNEKFIGHLCLQKGYVVDHIGKRRKRNKGELTKYYIEDNHPAIIDKQTFDAVQAERARRASRIKRPRELTFNEFSGIISCGQCGANFRRKVNSAGTKYAKVTWACATYTNRGKDECNVKRIPEEILKVKSAEALELTEYDPEKFTANISAITVPSDGILVFTFRDNTELALTWENPSRRESWTDEMKQAARERALERRRKNG